jgi:hypothetical protein
VREFAVNGILLALASVLYREQPHENRTLLYSIKGGVIGGFVAFLLRPSLMGKQVPLDDLVAALANLVSSKKMVIPLAETSLNLIFAGLLIGAMIGLGLAVFVKRAPPREA